VVEDPGAHHVPTRHFDRGERHQPAGLGQSRQVGERGGQLVAAEGREVSGLPQLRIGERRQERVHVGDHRKPQDEVACADPLGRHGQAQHQVGHD
jgi:hypothetical protein